MECPACHTPNIDGARFCAKCGALLPAIASEGEADPLIGTTVGGRFRITGVLGEGGMGRVYTGEQSMGTSVRKVAIKTLLAQYARDPQVLARFMRECGTVSELEHPNTIKVYDFGKTDSGELYIAMELLTGASLEKELEKGPLHPDRVDKILQQTAGSLQEAHEKGIVHRDLKPANIYLTKRAGEEDYVKVLDFGIAKRDEKHTKNEQKLTQQGTVLGTPPYMSPEQFKGHELDARSDVYSLGVVAYEMLTGRLPFDADTPWAWATQHMTAQPFPFETVPLGSQVPAKMKAAVMRALSKDKNQRQQSVKEFYEEFTLNAPRVGGRTSMPEGMVAGMGTGVMPSHAPMTSAPTQMGEQFPGSPITGGQPSYPSNPSMPAVGGGPYPSNPSMPAVGAVPTGSGQVYVPPPPGQTQKSGGGPLLAIGGAVIGIAAIVGLVLFLKKPHPAGGTDTTNTGPTATVTAPPDPTPGETATAPPTASSAPKTPPTPPPTSTAKLDPRAEAECRAAEAAANRNDLPSAKAHYHNCKGPSEVAARIAIDQAEKRNVRKPPPPPCRGKHCPR